MEDKNFRRRLMMSSGDEISIAPGVKQCSAIIFDTSNHGLIDFYDYPNLGLVTYSSPFIMKNSKIEIIGSYNGDNSYDFCIAGIKNVYKDKYKAFVTESDYALGYNKSSSSLDTIFNLGDVLTISGNSGSTLFKINNKLLNDSDIHSFGMIATKDILAKGSNIMTHVYGCFSELIFKDSGNNIIGHFVAAHNTINNTYGIYNLLDKAFCRTYRTEKDYLTKKYKPSDYITSSGGGQLLNNSFMSVILLDAERRMAA